MMRSIKYSCGGRFLLAVFLALACVPALQAEKDEPAVPVIKDGETQIVQRFADPDMWIRHDLWVETEFDSDGDGRLDRMHVDVTRPRQTDTEGLKVHVIYETSPYYAGTAAPVHDYMWDMRQELGAQPAKRKEAEPVRRIGERPIISKSLVKDWVPRGFAVVHSSSPGTGLSQGCPTVGGENESLAPKAVIDWLNGRAKGYTTPDGDEQVTAYWSTGRVGMTGTSYNGTLALAAATTGVQGLEAIIPVAPNTSYYHYYRSNGLVRSPGGYLGEDIDVLYDFINSGDEEKRAYCDCEIRDKQMLANFDRANGDYNDFWAVRDYLNHLDNVRAAVFMSHGFNDWNVMPEHSFRITEALKKKNLPLHIYYHQGGHGGPPPLKMMNRWFTRYLHGDLNGVDTEDRAWIVRENDDRSNPTAYKDYPNPDAAHVKLFLTPGAPQQGGLSTKRTTQKVTETLVDNFSFSGEALAQAEWTSHRLIYVTPELKRPLHISGVARVSIRLACSRPAANLSVWLVSLPWNTAPDAKITDNIITRGWADPQNHRSIRKGKPLEPGKFYKVAFDLQPDDQIIPAGQKIALMIFSSDRDHTFRPDPGAELTIDLSATHITLPIVGGPRTYAKAFEQ
ncbi:MAG TPA: Xaa-Pro dipeptidyl-peptidase [Anaerohalosphaeraceae bacterium]|jgi:X-Pro dipeptidyl-peptidase|nr:Xaa-Pro dipeptidyl-peptidase [Anaerohalosphaeraceae bacterium]HRT50269.1 Xaa-Pro dipeptidyl-peptidase [Anaerohalosphaeraceae bacterium]HRT86210.1 Xaa-Pro dipeptidyl-peptidase [Anaerohalosphaeraceae bacterium]